MKSLDLQPSLFDEIVDDGASVEEEGADTAALVGFRYVANFLDEAQHDELLREVDAQPWLDDLKRRVQHYGYKYDYKARHVDYSMRIGALPEWAATVAERLHREGVVPQLPDQLIVNEYQPGQGISNHIDCEPCFEDGIVSISLGSTCVMNFTSVQTRQVIPVLLEPRSLVLLQRESRFNWMHGIPARLKDKHAGRILHRARRVSLTFRKVVVK